MNKLVSFLVIAGFSLGLMAADDQNVTTHFELSYAKTDGNTESTDVASNLKVIYPFYSNSLRFVGNVLYSENTSYDENGTYIDTLRTKNRWDTELNYDFNFNETIAFNYLAGAKGDEFSTYVYQVYTGPGALVTAYENEAHNLKFQANVLHMWDRYRESSDADTNVTTPEFTERYYGYQASMDYIYQFTTSAKFIQYLMYRSEFKDTSNYFVKSKTAVEAKISDMFSMGVSYTIDYTNNITPEIRSNYDSVFLASFIADF